MPNRVLSALKKATKGLSYQSESDAPFVAFLWNKPGEKVTKQAVLKQAGKEKARPVKQLALDEFFGDLTQEQDWHGDEEKAEVKRYQELLRVLREQLSDVQVFKVGEPQVDIYVVGKTKEGDWAGVKTSAVET